MITDADARAEESRAQPSWAYCCPGSMRRNSLRAARTPEALRQGGLRAAGALAVFVVFLLLLVWAYRRGEGAAEKFLQDEDGEDPARALPGWKRAPLG